MHQFALTFLDELRRCSIVGSRRMTRAIVIAGGLWLISESTLAQGEEFLPESMAILPTPFRQGVDDKPKQVQKAYYEFIWKSFIALNWPSDLEFRGQPDTDAHIRNQSGPGQLRPSVWETYREPSEVFISPDRWDDYPVWNAPRPQPPGLPSGARTLMKYSRGFAEYATDINQPYFFNQATGPLIDQNGNFVRYEVAINQAFFTYIKHFQYYDASRQIADVAVTVANPMPPNSPPWAPRKGFQRPPHGNEPYLVTLPNFARQGLVDVKAAWRVLEPDKGDLLGRYLHRDIVVDEDARVQTMGLVALHILRYILVEEIGKDGKPVLKDGRPVVKPGYVAATFEQVDNVKTEVGSGIKPSFNAGAEASPEQNTYGFDYSIPPIARKTDPKPRAPISIYRAEAQKLPHAVKKINDTYQKLLAPSVFQYYKLIGTQNKHPGKTLDFTDTVELRSNGHEGPITGVYTNTNNLVNSALESYTQKNFSCILCHVRARPQGVPEKAFEVDYFKTLTFLLQMAQSPFEN